MEPAGNLRVHSETGVERIIMTDETQNVKSSENQAATKAPEKPEPKDNLVETAHSITIAGKQIQYTVLAGTMVMKE